MIETKFLLSQHFLVNDKIVKLVSDRVIPGAIVYEIGPGMGKLTQSLCKKAKKVTAIEIDQQFENQLNHLQKKYKNLKIVYGDVLKFNWENEILGNKNNKIQIISSLPYHITEPFLQQICHFRFDRIDLIVGEALVKAIEKNKEKRGVLVNTFYNFKVLANLSRDDFEPKPRVKSALIELWSKDEKGINVKDFLLKKMFLTNKTGALLKNFFREGLILYTKDKLTKNEAREIIKKMEIEDGILNKSFGQINNKELEQLILGLTKVI